MGTSNAFTDCGYFFDAKSALPRFNCQNYTTHKTDVLDSQPVRQPDTLELMDKWKRTQKPLTLFFVL